MTFFAPIRNSNVRGVHLSSPSDKTESEEGHGGICCSFQRGVDGQEDDLFHLFHCGIFFSTNHRHRCAWFEYGWRATQMPFGVLNAEISFRPQGAAREEVDICIFLQCRVEEKKTFVFKWEGKHNHLAAAAAAGRKASQMTCRGVNPITKKNWVEFPLR